MPAPHPLLAAALSLLKCPLVARQLKALLCCGWHAGTGACATFKPSDPAQPAAQPHFALTSPAGVYRQQASWQSGWAAEREQRALACCGGRGQY